MGRVHGYEFPDDLLYHVDNNIWVALRDNRTVSLGLTAYACALAGSVTVFTPKPVGRGVDRNKSGAMVETAKWVGPVRIPFDAEIVAVNEAAVADPGLINRDPYGRGWLLRLRPENWMPEQAHLFTGAVATQAFEQRMHQDGLGA